MQIIKETFQVKIIGKCLNEKDILQLFSFGFSKENVVKKYNRDNKLKIEDARRVVENILLKNIRDRSK